MLEVLDSRKQQEEDMWKELEDYLGHVGHREETIEYLEMTQSNATEAENWENDFIEVSRKTKELGWSEGKGNRKCWLESV